MWSFTFISFFYNYIILINSYYYYISNYILLTIVNYYLTIQIYWKIRIKYNYIKNKIIRRIRLGKRLRKKRTHWATRKKYAKILHTNHNIPLNVCNDIFFHYIY